MRSREEIVKEYKAPEHHIREILLDIRDLMVKANKKPRKKREAKNVK